MYHNVPFSYAILQMLKQAFSIQQVRIKDQKLSLLVIYQLSENQIKC